MSTIVAIDVILAHTTLDIVYVVYVVERSLVSKDMGIL